MAVYDAFLFFNELDLLEIRLNLLNDFVDHFVISESNISFSGKEKPLYYLENKDRFKKFEQKIIHQVITDNPSDFTSLRKYNNPANEDEVCVNKIYTFIDEATNFPKNELHWGRDFFQRECLHRALVHCSDDDVIIFSDIDEIPNPDILDSVISFFPTDNIYTLRQKEFSCYLNMYKQDAWMGPRVATYSILKNISLNKIRAHRKGGKPLIDAVDVQNGGWHFTNLGGTEKIIQKIESWSHQEFNTDKIKKNIKKRVESGKDIFNRRGIKKLQPIKVDEETFPKWLVDNKQRYAHLIRIDPISNNKDSLINKFLKMVFRR
jgi:beta-1,4-mannosyl-glycoprotein beta-1,4-N-acetylglucosaminyltransferase